MRNGSGGYSLPSNSWNPALNGAPATAGDWQALINDVAAAIQQSISADGQTTITGNLQMGGNKLTNLAAGSAAGNSVRFEQLFGQGALTDIASASITDIGAPLTNFLRVTGTTGITSFGTNYNGPKFLIFAGAVTLTNSATLVLPSGGDITTAAGDSMIVIPLTAGWQVVAFQRASGDLFAKSINGGQIAGNRNKLINGSFAHNQRVVSGTVTLSAGAYGHDYWKAGASGCTYTFATTNNVTTITITAGSLTQIINGRNLNTGTYVLSWTGTAQGRVGGGSYAASGLTAAITGGTNTTIEFNTGSLTFAQFEIGTTPTAFEFRHNELQLCQQRYFKTYSQTVAPGTAGAAGPAGITAMAACNFASFPVAFPVTMEAVPTCTIYGANDGIVGRITKDASWIAGSAVQVGQNGCLIRAGNQPVLADNFLSSHLVAVAGL